MKKIAFIVLSYGDFAKADIWKKFFQNANHDLYNIYIHPKVEISNDSYFAKYQLDRFKVISTHWGKYSLVQATNILLECALNHDKLNEYFILLSDSHLPLWNFSETYNWVINNISVCTFMPMKVLNFSSMQHNHKRFIKAFGQNKLIQLQIFKQDKKNSKQQFDEKTFEQYFPFKRKIARVVSQWFMCTRSDAIAFVQAEKKYRHLFNHKDYSYIDEMFFHLIATHLNIPIQFIPHTYIDWSKETEFRFRRKTKCRRMPRTFSECDDLMIEDLRKKNYIFLRKAHKETQVSKEYENLIQEK